MKKCGIYVITHRETGLKYVGQSVNIDVRLAAHSRDRRSTHISNAIKKHGWGSFAVEIVEICDQSALNEAEARWISTLNCVSPYGYNLTSGGELRIPNEETRAKMAAAKLGSRMPEATRLAMAAANIGRRRTEESKQKTASKLKSRTFSEETRQRMAESAKKRYSEGHGAVLVERAATANKKAKLLRDISATATA